MIARNGKNQPSDKSQLSEDMPPKPAINKTEVVLTSKRRQFSKRYKKRILLEAEQCQHGLLGALLRREGLYSSHLSTWRRELATGKLDGSDREKKADKKRIEQLERDNTRLKRDLQKAEAIITAQKKLAELIEIMNESE